jgi:uncharacterized damage-inducible protein DinB
MSLSAALLQEIETEGKTTRRVLERVPADKLTWKPHQKSMSLGELALHIAKEPGHFAEAALRDEFDFGGAHPGNPQPSTVADILTTHDQGLATVKSSLNKLGDAGLQNMWTAKMNGATLMTMPKAGLMRMIVMNHIYHHRGQLSVYLRMLDVPVPSIYGPSADDNPFAVARA